MKKFVLLSAVVLLMAAGCNNQAATTTENPPATPPTSSTTNPPAADSSVKTFTVAGSNFKFSLSTMTVNKGDKVRITFQNSGGNHDFVLDEFNVKTAILNSGQSEIVEFTADKTGQFEYYCAVGTHRQMGMKGTLVVQ